MLYEVIKVDHRPEYVNIAMVTLKNGMMFAVYSNKTNVGDDFAAYVSDECDAMIANTMGQYMAVTYTNAEKWKDDMEANGYNVISTVRHTTKYGVTFTVCMFSLK